MNLEDKINMVNDILKDKHVAVGFSGGADSTLIAYLSSKVAEDTLAITINNHLMPKGFIENTQKTTEALGIRHEVIDINFYEDDEFLKNSTRRCFTCRSLMYSTIKKVALKNGFDYICDGNNISDLVADRPGILITYENNFKTPFIEAKLSSAEIHQYLNKNNIPYSRSTTCLATRIPTNTQVTPEKIQKISDCEDYIYTNTECEIVKVRDYKEIGIVEVDKLNEIISKDKYNQINDELKSHGFKKVALNLSPIEDNEYIKLDHSGDSFSYQLPFTVNMENTLREIEKIISYDEEKIELEKITVHANGLVEGHGLESYDIALDTFMETLPKLRRNI